MKSSFALCVVFAAVLGIARATEPPQAPRVEAAGNRESEIPDTEKQKDYADVPPQKLGVVPVKAKKDQATGFVVGGTNKSDLIRSLTQINGVAIADLEKSMRPRELSENGFLGNDERLLDVMVADNQWILKSELTHQELARHLRILATIARMELFVTDGYQDSPFKDGTKTNSDLTVINVDNGKALSYSLLVPLMIERYGFYEGKGTPYRVDPSKVIEVLTFLKPNKR